MTNILIQQRFTKEDIAYLEKQYDVKIHVLDKDDLPTQDILDTIEIHVGWGNKDIITQCPNLKWVHVFSAGVDRPSKTLGAMSTPPRLTNNKGTYGVPLTEHTMAMLFGITRKINYYVN